MCFSWRRFGATKTVSGSQQQRTALILKRRWLGRASGSEILSSKKFQKNSHTISVWSHSETIRGPGVELERPRWLMLFETRCFTLAVSSEQTGKIGIAAAIDGPISFECQGKSPR